MTGGNRNGPTVWGQRFNGIVLRNCPCREALDLQDLHILEREKSNYDCLKPEGMHRLSKGLRVWNVKTLRRTGPWRQLHRMIFFVANEHTVEYASF